METIVNWSPQKCWTILVAGGAGTRMGGDLPKQFQYLAGKPILICTIERFLAVGLDQIVLVIPADYHQLTRQLLTQFVPECNPILAVGGASRTLSVLAGLAVLPPEAIVVGIHDAVRPMVSPVLLKTAYQHALIHHSAIPVVAVKDSLRKKTNVATVAVDRSEYMAVQTPQVFEVNSLKLAYKQLDRNDISDDATVFESAGHDIHIIEGDYRNIKLTTPEDMVLAEALWPTIR